MAQKSEKQPAQKSSRSASQKKVAASKAVEHQSPVSDELSNTKYARGVKHTSPVADELSNTKYARNVEHTSPVSDELSNTKYARGVEHVSPVADDLSNTKYARQGTTPTGDETLGEKRLLEVAMEETLVVLNEIVERSVPLASVDAKAGILSRLIDNFGTKTLEINLRYFRTKD